MPTTGEDRGAYLSPQFDLAAAGGTCGVAGPGWQLQPAAGCPCRAGGRRPAADSSARPPTQPTLPLLKVALAAPVASLSDARALGQAAADQLRAAGAERYLAG